MILKKILKSLLIMSISLFFFGCLQTRSDADEANQSQVYRKKMSDNQKSQSEDSVNVKIDERDEMIRVLNGRVETLEGQIALLIKEKEASPQSGSVDSQKMMAFQEALTKMEAQIIKLESAPQYKSSDALAKGKPAVKSKNAFEIAEDHFQNQEWKKAILSYQKYVEETPKGKSVSESKYKIGVCFQELGLKDEAIAFYEEVISQFPKSEAGKKSKIRLDKLTVKKKK